jgi:hypothetical protein
MKTPVLPDDAMRAFVIYRNSITASGGKCKYTYADHLQHWTKLVQVARRYGVDAERVIRARFAAVKPILRAGLTPANMYSPLMSVKMSLDSFDSDKFLDWPKLHDNMLALLEGSSDRMGVPRNMLLLDPMTSFYTWFRIAAMNPADARISERYLDTAVTEVMNDLALKQFIKEKLDGCVIRNFAGRI